MEYDRKKTLLNFNNSSHLIILMFRKITTHMKNMVVIPYLLSMCIE